MAGKEVGLGRRCKFAGDQGAGKEGRQRRTAGSAPAVSVTISIGMAEREAHQRGVDEVIRSADKALYAAKQAGRNRVMAQGESRRGAVRVKSPVA